MINQIDIVNFGSFSEFNWKKAIRDGGNSIQNFKRLNILYGRNYSGKTTLSRIFRALETGRLPLNYSTPSFVMYGDKGDITQTCIDDHCYDIRVYNSDFVSDNLSFLVNQANGEIKTFAIVGELNKEIENAITEIDKKLGSVEEKAGLRHDLGVRRKDRDRALSVYKAISDSLEEKLRVHANEKIKKNREYGNTIYNIDGIKRDIAVTKETAFKPLSAKDQAIKLLLLKQEALPSISAALNIELKISGIRRLAESLLSRVIAPTKPIQELLDNSILQSWVKQGVPLHKENRSTCAFCRQSLPADIWQILDAHFSKESSDLEAEINDCLASIATEIDSIPRLLLLTADQFYPEERASFELCKEGLNKEFAIYRYDLESLKLKLEQRIGSLFQVLEMPGITYNSEGIQEHVSAINRLIIKNNERSKTLEGDKNSARDELRLTDVASFIRAINYDVELARIAALKVEAEAANNIYIEAEREISACEVRATQLRGQQKDERKGAEKVNALLTHFFGHDGIKLEARENLEKTVIKFEITRNGQSAYNLSEGECSLIAFCYFIAKLEEPESKDKELIIYIDDPISSLDGNHIFFMFSLIESRLAKPAKNADGSNYYRYKQLFISTHNLDFLKYLKRLSIPLKKNSDGVGRDKNVKDDESFLIERSGASSNIMLMPAYLREYITEFNYLFHQIYKCRNESDACTTHEPFYSFGNNLRKFLEAFLFFKYPYHDNKSDALERIRKFFGEDDPIATSLINRLNNEFSHLEAIPDRGFKPVEIPEISKIANFVLDKIYESDCDQYNALLKSIGVSGRVG